VVVHDAAVRFGFGAEVVRLVTEQAWDALRCAPRVLGGLNLPIPYSAALEDVCVPSEGQIVETIRQVVA